MAFETYTSHPTLMRLILETKPESKTHEMLSCNGPAHRVKFKSSEQFRFIKMGLEEAPEVGLLYRVEADNTLIVKPISETEALVFNTSEPERYGIEVEGFELEEAAKCPERHQTLADEIKHTPFPFENGMGVKMCRELEKRGLVHLKRFKDMDDQQRWRAKEAWDKYINDTGTAKFWVPGPSQEWLDKHGGEPPEMEESLNEASLWKWRGGRWSDRDVVRGNYIKGRGWQVSVFLAYAGRTRELSNADLRAVAALVAEQDRRISLANFERHAFGVWVKLYVDTADTPTPELSFAGLRDAEEIAVRAAKQAAESLSMEESVLTEAKPYEVRVNVPDGVSPADVEDELESEARKGRAQIHWSTEPIHNRTVLVFMFGDEQVAQRFHDHAVRKVRRMRGVTVDDSVLMRESVQLDELQNNPSSVRNPINKKDVGDKKKIVGGFRFRVGGGKHRPRKDIRRSIQSKRNARRGLAKRIRAVKKFHKSPQGQRLHRALGRFNATNRTNEHRESNMQFSNGDAYCEGRVYVWGMDEDNNVSVHAVAPGMSVEEWCKQFSLHGAAYLGEQDFVISAFNSLLNEEQEAKLVEGLNAHGKNVSVYDDEPDYAMVEQAARLSRVVSTGVKKRDGLWSIDEGYAIWLPSLGLRTVPAYERTGFVALLGESYASEKPAWMLRDNRKDETLWSRDVVINTDEGDQLVSVKGSAYVSEAHEARFVCEFKPALETKAGSIRHVDIPVMDNVNREDIPELKEQGKLDGFGDIFDRQFKLTEAEADMAGMVDPFGLEDTLDDVFDDILALLVVNTYLDLLQDVEFDDEYGSIILYFDPTTVEEEMLDIMSAIDGEYPGSSIIATPDASLPGEFQTSDWWVVFVPGSEDAPVPSLESTDDGGIQTGFDGVATSDDSVGKVVAQIDLGAALGAASGKK